MVNWKSKKLGDLLILANGIVLIILGNVLGQLFFFRLDLTEEKRYSIKPQTKEILAGLEDKVYIEVYLEGDLNPGFKRFSKAIRETLEEFRVYSNDKVSYVFVDPAKAKSQKARNEFMAELAAKGIQPTNVIDNQSGQRIEKLIFPGALVSYSTAETGVMLLKGNKAGSPEEEINQSIEGIEFEFANAIRKLSDEERKTVGIVLGHGELDSVQAAGVFEGLSGIYSVMPVDLSRDYLPDFDALVIARPTRLFSTGERFSLDQYLMQGGKVLMMLDKLSASMDSASTDSYFAFPVNTGLDDQLFRYGVRINPDLVLDQHAGFFPVVTGQSGSSPRIQLLEWPFFPRIHQYADHPVTRNLDAVLLRFASSMDTVKAPGVKKTPLLFTSPFTRRLSSPVNVNINQFRNADQGKFDEGRMVVACLLEGKFTSAFKNRFLPAEADKEKFMSEGVPAKLIVVSDGDLARNEINPRSGKALPLGFDPYTKYTYANQELVLNMLSFLIDENGLILARNKEIMFRPLDRSRIADEKTKWQIINLGVPVILVLTFGVFKAFFRKRKYSRFI